MKYIGAIIVCIGALTLLAQVNSKPQASTVNQPIEKCSDHDETKEFNLKINDSIPIRTIKLRLKNIGEDQQFREVTGCTEIYSENELIQVIHEPCPDEGGCGVPYNEYYYNDEDVNFDGDKDLYFLSSAGATGNASFHYWIYNPAIEKFEKNSDFSDKLFSPTFHPESREISCIWDGGAAGMVYTEDYYRVSNGKLDLIKKIEQDQTEDQSAFKKVTKIFDNGTVVSESVENIPAD